MYMVYSGKKNPKTVELKERVFEFTPGKPMEVPKAVGSILLQNASDIFSEVEEPKEKPAGKQVKGKGEK